MADRKLTKNGAELAEALSEVLGDVTGATPLQGRTIDIPDTIDVKAIRKRLKMSQQRFADTFGMKVASLRNWEQERTEPDRQAKVLLTIISRKPKETLEALYFQA